MARQVEAGQRVRKGQALAQLDPRDYALAQTSAESQVTAAQADVEVAQAELRRYQELRTARILCRSWIWSASGWPRLRQRHG
jgi:multidrug efflux system membrane fusion protein